VRTVTVAVATCLVAGVISLTAAERARPRTHTVSLEGMRFQPDDLTVALGDTIVWVNKDLVAHTATSESGGFDSKIIEPEQAWTFTIRKRGDFPYVCVLHPTMKAMLRVK
jgi:plastocyanin